jgi:8-oxo-dGTP pyrophosphatase MutT (NUDIX family)
VLAAARRELLEELGCEAKQWNSLGIFMTSNGWSSQLITVFEARGLASLERHPAGPEEESASVRWFTRDDLRETLRNEPAIDVTTALALSRLYGTFFDDL